MVRTCMNDNNNCYILNYIKVFARSWSWSQYVYHDYYRITIKSGVTILYSESVRYLAIDLCNLNTRSCFVGRMASLTGMFCKIVKSERVFSRK